MASTKTSAQKQQYFAITLHLQFTQHHRSRPAAPRPAQRNSNTLQSLSFACVHASQVTVNSTEITEINFEEIRSKFEDIVQEKLDSLLSIAVECPVSVRGCGCKQRLG
jgi:hypothetical protein